MASEVTKMTRDHVPAWNRWVMQKSTAVSQQRKGPGLHLCVYESGQNTVDPPPLFKVVATEWAGWSNYSKVPGRYMDQFRRWVGKNHIFIITNIKLKFSISFNYELGGEMTIVIIVSATLSPIKIIDIFISYSRHELSHGVT